MTHELRKLKFSVGNFEMDVLAYCRAMVSYCRQRAHFEGESIAFWSEEAAQWEALVREHEGRRMNSKEKASIDMSHASTTRLRQPKGPQDAAGHPNLRTRTSDHHALGFGNGFRSRASDLTNACDEGLDGSADSQAGARRHHGRTPARSGGGD